MNFIELTDENNNPLLINLEHVTVISPNDTGSILLFDEGSHAKVRESFGTIQWTVDWRMKNA